MNIMFPFFRVFMISDLDFLEADEILHPELPRVRSAWMNVHLLVHVLVCPSLSSGLPGEDNEAVVECLLGIP